MINDFIYVVDLLGVLLSCGFLFECDKNWFVFCESFVKLCLFFGVFVVYRKVYEGINIRFVCVFLNSL